MRRAEPLGGSAIQLSPVAHPTIVPSEPAPDLIAGLAGVDEVERGVTRRESNLNPPQAVRHLAKK
jgi:hypothetical protein